QNRGQREHTRDLPLGAALGLRVDVGEPGRRMVQAGVGYRVCLVAGARRSRLAVGGDDLGAGVTVHVLALRAHDFDDLVTIQVAMPISTPMPISHAHRPSATGPARPMPRPPGLGSSSTDFKKAMMSCLS